MKQTRMKYVVAIPKSVLLVVTILTLALFTSIYPIIQWKPVFASPDTAEDYVDIQSDVDSVIDKGTHSNFTAQMYGPDSTYDTLTEANTGGVTIEDYVDQISNVDGVADVGTHSNFTAEMYGPDGTYDTLTEANQFGNSQNFVDGQSDVDSHADHGTHSSFANMQAGPDSTFDTLTEADTDTGTSQMGKTSGTGTSYVTVAVNTMYGGVFSATSTGEIPSAVFYGRGASATVNVKAVICDSSGNILTNGVSAALSVTTSAGTKTCLFSAGSRPLVTSGTTYWIMFIPSGNLRFYYDSTTGGTSKYDSSNVYASPTSPTDATDDTHTWRLCYANINNLNYELDLEFQWITADFDEANEYLCIYTGTVNAEALKVDVRNGAGWTNIIASLNASQWNNVSIGTYLTSETITFRFLGGTETGDTSQNTWQIDVAIIHAWTTGANYVLELEVQFTEAIDFLPVEKLCIKTGTFSGSEDINVTYWTGSTWSSITSDLTASAWNNYTVSITSATFTIKFGGSTTSSDTVQDTWNIDAVLLQLSGAGADEDFVDNEDSDVDASADIGTLADFTNLQASDSTYATLTEAPLPDIKDLEYTSGIVAGESQLILTAPTGITSGELLVIIVMSDDNAAGPYFNAVTDWTKQGESGSATADAKIALYYKIATGSETDVTVTATSLDNIIGWYIRLGDINTADIIEASNFAESTSTGTNPHVIPAITTVTTNCLVLYGLAFDGGDGNPMSVNSVWTEVDDQTVDGTANTEGGSWGYRILAGSGSSGTASVTTDAQTDGAAYFQVAFNTAYLNYTLDHEVQFTDILPDADLLPIQTLCIYAGSMGVEDILIQYWTGSDWQTLFSDLVADSWNNITIVGNLSASTFTIRFRDGVTGDTSTGDVWYIDAVLIYLENGGGVNYELELEEQFTSCNYTRTNEELCIKTGTFNAGGETLSVQWWNSTSSSWLTIISSLSTSQWNNVSVTDYLTSATFTIRFIDGTKTSDSSQGTWQKDACLLHTWTLGYNLNLRVMDLDLTDNIQGAYVYKDSDVKTSDAEGWANWTEVSGTVQIKVQYFGFWVNETSLTISSDRTMSLQCKLYDVIVNVRENVRNAKLSNVNVTVYNSTNYKIKSGISDNNGQVSLLNLPNNTLTFTCYAKSDYSLVIKNVARNITQDEQIETIICDENYIGTTSNYSILVWVGGIVIPLEGSFVTNRLKRKMYKKKKEAKQMKAP